MIKILVPVDGSEASIKAAEKSVQLAKIDHSEVTFLAIVEGGSDIAYEAYADGIADAEDYLAMREALLKRKIDNVTKMLDGVVDGLDSSGIAVSKKVILGDAHPTIVKTAKEGKFNLIMMGHRGMNPIKRLFIGSVAKRVIEDSPCSVLIVK